MLKLRICGFFLITLSMMASALDMPLKKMGCNYTTQLTVEDANAYYQSDNQDINSWGFMPSKLFNHKALPISLNCFYIGTYSQHTDVKNFTYFYNLTESQKQAAGYILIDQGIMPMLDYTYTVPTPTPKNDGIVRLRYVLYKSFLILKKPIGSCDIYYNYVARIDSHTNKLQIYLKNNDPKKIACYWDNNLNSIVMKAIPQS